MQNIDFLPNVYREQSAMRKAKLWGLVVVALFGSVIAVTAVVQLGFRRAAHQRLAEVDSQHNQARAQTDRLTQLQENLNSLRHAADLHTYLKHPWPRTRILAALTAPLPESILLEELRIIRDDAPAQDAAEETEVKRRPPNATEGDETDQLSPAQKDLKRLRNEIDGTDVVVHIAGVTNDAAALHQYLATMGNSSLFAKVELSSIESLGPEYARGASRFNARLVVLPGFGQPGGPDAPETPPTPEEAPTPDGASDAATVAES